MTRPSASKPDRPRNVMLICGMLALLWAQDSRAEDGPLAIAVKAAFITKFVPFVEWPNGTFPAANAPVTICVGGGSGLSDLLDRIADRQMVEGHPLAVRRLLVITRDGGCDLLFAAGSAEQSVADMLNAVRGTHVLTLTDAASQPRDRGIINFVVIDNRVRFEIDKIAAARNGLVISSKLLSLAVRVLDDKP